MSQTPVETKEASEVGEMQGVRSVQELQEVPLQLDVEPARRVSTFKDEIQAESRQTGRTGCFSWYFALEDAYPLVLALRIVAGKAFVVADVITDYIVVIALFGADHPNWAAVSLVFCVLPYLTLWLVLLPAMKPGANTWSPSSNSQCLFVLYLLFGPLLFAFGDVVLLTVYLWRDLPADNVILAFYIRQRQMVEVLFESVPQLCLQVWICFSDDVDIDNLPLVVSIVSSALSVVKQLYRIHRGSEAVNVPQWKYALALLTGGKGDAASISLLKCAAQLADRTRADLILCQIDDQGAAILAQALEVNNTVTAVDLLRNDIGDRGAEALAAAMKVNSTVVELDLTKNRIGAKGAQAIAECLEVNRTLTIVHLSRNHVGDQGAGALAQALRMNPVVVEVNLIDNQIGLEGARALAEALKLNRSVTKMNLRVNEIGAGGARALAEALEVNHTLTQLDLFKNTIGDAGATALAAAIGSNRGSRVVEVDLGYNEIGDPGAEAWALALKASHTVRAVDFRYNLIGDHGARALAEAVAGNMAAEFAQQPGPRRRQARAAKPSGHLRVMGSWEMKQNRAVWVTPGLLLSTLSVRMVCVTL